MKSEQMTCKQQHQVLNILCPPANSPKSVQNNNEMKLQWQAWRLQIKCVGGTRIKIKSINVAHIIC